MTRVMFALVKNAQKDDYDLRTTGIRGMSGHTSGVSIGCEVYDG